MRILFPAIETVNVVGVLISHLFSSGDERRACVCVCKLFQLSPSEEFWYETAQSDNGDFRDPATLGCDDKNSERIELQSLHILKLQWYEDLKENKLWSC
jgi:hypothetical protein